MSYRIVIDSCGEIPEELKKTGNYVNVPLELEVDNCRIVDDESFDQADFLRRVKESPNSPKSSCPSPEAFMEKFQGDVDHIYVVTLSAQLSGSYNSAVLAKNLYEEENGEDKKIYIFNSRSASIGQTLIGMKAEELEKQGLSFEEVVEQTEAYIESQHTYFVLETLETLRKAGRLSHLKEKVANVLNIKPIMGSTPEGNICQLGQARGINKALGKMVETMVERVTDSKEKIIAVSHCNCPERAEFVKKKLEDLNMFKEIVVLDTAGVSSMYANDGGIIMVV